MKKKILISLITCFIAAGSIIHLNLAENTSRMDVSLADISVMAQADGENNACPGWDGITPYCQWDDVLKECVDQAECNSSCPESECN